METQFYILLSLKTPQGFANYGHISLMMTVRRFMSYSGSFRAAKNFKSYCLLHIDLMETMNGLPVQIKTKCCTLEKLGLNCKLIARELFRLKNLEEME